MFHEHSLHEIGAVKQVIAGIKKNLDTTEQGAISLASSSRDGEISLQVEEERGELSLVEQGGDISLDQ